MMVEKELFSLTREKKKSVYNELVKKLKSL